MKIKIPAMEDVGFQMAPMIDIVFQLMIFFMCASHLHVTLEAPKIYMPVAAHASVPTELTPDRRNITVKVDGTVLLNAQPITLSQLRTAVAKAQKEIPTLKIFLRADARVEHKKVREVMAACAEGGAADIIFAAYQAEGPPPE
jgi:biopolymer transport protein ExbD